MTSRPATQSPDSAGMPASAPRAVLLVGAATAALLIAAGGLLWARLGGTVFSDYVLGGLAWCL